MKKGFTLIELLGVIIILALVMILVFPSVINFIKKGNKTVDDATLKLIYNAADMYIRDNQDSFPKNKGKNYCIPINELIENENLNKNLISENLQLKTVQLTYNNGFKYNIVDDNTCEENYRICKKVDENSKTTGNIPKGDFDIGDEYICNVDGKNKYHFFVLSYSNSSNEVITDKNNATMINLILDRNVYYRSDSDYGLSEGGDTVAYASLADYIGVGGTQEEYGTYGSSNKGPLTALKYLKNATKNWSNINNIDYIYTDENGRFGPITISGKARLARLDEVRNLLNNKPLWLFNYLWNSSDQGGISLRTWGYWLLSSASASGAAYDIYGVGIHTNGTCYQWYTIKDTGRYGVRPIITLELSQFD